MQWTVLIADLLDANTMVTNPIARDPSMKAFNGFDLRLKKAVCDTPHSEMNPVLLRFMADELLMTKDNVTALTKIQYLGVVYRVSMSPHTLSAYEASPLQAVAKEGAEKSLEAIIEFNKEQLAKKKKVFRMDPGVVKAAMCDIITAKVSRKVSCRMIRTLLKMDTYRAFDCSAFNLDHFPCFVVSQGRMDVLRELCVYDPDTKNIPMTEFVTKEGVDQPCQCEHVTCNVAAVVELFEIGCEISGFHTCYNVREMCDDGLKLFQTEMAKQPDREIDEDYDSDNESDEESDEGSGEEPDEEERDSKKQKLSGD